MQKNLQAKDKNIKLTQKKGKKKVFYTLLLKTHVGKEQKEKNVYVHRYLNIQNNK